MTKSNYNVENIGSSYRLRPRVFRSDIKQRQRRSLQHGTAMRMVSAGAALVSSRLSFASHVLLAAAAARRLLLLPSSS